MNPGMFLARSLFARQRIGLSAVAAYYVVGSVLLLGIGPVRLPGGIMIFGAAVGFLALIYLSSIFIHPDSDVASPKSTYPTYYFTLPIRTFDLALWPMAAGILVMGGSVLIMCGVLRASHIDVDPIWPPLMAASLIALLQAIFWYPIGIPYAKLVLAIAAMVGLAIIGPSGQAVGLSEAQQVYVFVAIILISLILGSLGVLKARRGDFRESIFGDRAEPQVRAKSTSRALSRPFASASKAQLWYEWKRQGKVLPYIALIAVILFALPIHWETTRTPLYYSSDPLVHLIPAVPTYLLYYYPILLFSLPIFAWFIGAGAKATDSRQGDGAFHLFFATRPLTDWSMALIKIKTSALSAMAAWGIVLILSIPFLWQTSGFYDESHLPTEFRGPLYSVLGNYFTGEIVLRALCWVLLLVFLTWRNYVVGFWTELSGKAWLRYSYPIAILMGIALYPSISVILRLDSKLAGAVNICYWILGLTVCKLALAYILLSKQLRSGLIRPISAMKLIAAWLVGTSVIVMAFLNVTQPLRIAVEQSGVPTPSLLYMFPVLAIFWSPLVRILAAPVALSSNRHR